jgi:single-strand DNA-binding protein
MGGRRDHLHLPVSAWDRLAGFENAAESLRKDDRVTVVGEIRARSYTTKDNEARTVLEVTAAEIGLSLKFTPAHAAKGTKASQDVADVGRDSEDEAPF